jgi:N,N-dimethylformamidase beta subunit-like protein
VAKGRYKHSRPRRVGPLTIAGAIALGLVCAVATAALTRANHGAHRRALPDVARRGEVQAPSPTVAEPIGTKAWAITDPGKQHDLEGYADRVSAFPGDPVKIFVSTTRPSFTVTAYRMGWYGGTQGTSVWTSGTVAGHKQNPSHLDKPTNTVTTSWAPSLSVPTANWPPGDYLLRLDGGGIQRFIPLTLRSRSVGAKLVIVNAVTTWQAYNAWGGYSLYHGAVDDADFDGRARAVSFDRPYAGDGAADFVGNELPLISLVERLGLPVAYVTDVDLHADPTALDGARAVVTLGHDEYWSTQMRDAVTSARDRGVNVAFLGANAVFRHIRMTATSNGPNRLEIDYKRSNEDPLLHTNPREVTSDWREPPVPRIESDLTGVLYECNPVKADLVVTNPGNWLFAGSGATNGTHLPNLIGPEYDRVNPGGPLPHPIEVLAHSPVTCRRVHSFSDVAYYTTTSGAGVFSTGTSSWVAALTCTDVSTCPITGRVVTAVTTNLLKAFTAGPSGLVHPAVENIAALHEFSGDPIAQHASAD